MASQTSIDWDGGSHKSGQPDVGGISNQNTGENKGSLKLGITVAKILYRRWPDGSPLNQNDLLNLIVVICEEFAFVYGGLWLFQMS